MQVVCGYDSTAKLGHEQLKFRDTAGPPGACPKLQAARGLECRELPFRRVGQLALGLRFPAVAPVLSALCSVEELAERCLPGA